MEAVKLSDAKKFGRSKISDEDLAFIHARIDLFKAVGSKDSDAIKEALAKRWTNTRNRSLSWKLKRSKLIRQRQLASVGESQSYLTEKQALPVPRQGLFWHRLTFLAIAFISFMAERTRGFFKCSST